MVGLVVRVGINGFGNIGRRFFRLAWADENLQVVGVNDIAPMDMLAHLLRRDSTYGPFHQRVKTADGQLEIGDERVAFFAQRDPAHIPWGDLGVDVVVESTAVFRDAGKARAHIDAGAGKVIISAPAKNADVTIVPGVNEGHYDSSEHTIVSMASCTTNCLAPVALSLDDEFGLIKGLMTTVHAYTSDQRILDLPHSDWRRARAAATNIIPTSTGAAEAVGLVLPHLKGRLSGISMRVPVAAVSVVDLVAQLGRPVTADEVNSCLQQRAEGDLRGIMATTTEPLVSSDIKGDPHSAVVDLPLTAVIGDDMVKVVAWYDNEWGYSARLCDLARLIGNRG